MNYKSHIYSEGFVSTMPLETKKKHRAPSHKTGDNQKQIDYCLQCTEEKCNGNCKIVNALGKDNKICANCPEMKYNGDYDLYYCDKYNQVVEKSDLCIEVGYDEVFGGNNG